MREFSDVVGDIFDACRDATREFEALVLRYVKSMDPGTDPLAQATMKSMAACIVEDLFTKVDDELDNPSIAHAVVYALENRAH